MSVGSKHYSSIVLALENIYEISHEPEALGLSKALSSHSITIAMYLLDYILPQVAKLSRALHTKHLDLSLISSLVDATLNSLDDAILPSSENWVLQLQDAREELKAATDIEVTHLDICSFQERVGKPFIRLIKDNISSQFRSSSKAKSLEGTQFKKAAIVCSDLSTEWKTYHQLIKQPKDDIYMQLKELLTNDMLIALFPNLHKLATICLSIPISTTSAEQSFSDMKLIKNRLRNRLTELSLSNLMIIVMESPEKLTDSDLEEIVDVWNRKGRRIAV